MSDIAMRLAQTSTRARQPGDLAQPASGVASVSVHADPREVADEWRTLAASWPATPYQHPDWLLAWTETVGAASAIRPMIVVARDAAGAPMALLPFGVERRGGLSTAVFLGGRDANFNMGLFRRGTAWTREGLRDLLRRAARASALGVDLYALRNQPLAWDGFANPMAALEQQPSPSFAYKAALAADPEAFFKAHLSRESRKKLRQKTTRIKGCGDVAFVRPTTPGEIAEVLDALFLQRRERCEMLGLPTDELATLRTFLDRATAGPTPAVELHALRCGGRVVATMAGARRGARFSGMLTSFAADPELARASPGELLLAEVVRRACEDGLTAFDLGIGEARYKESYCPEVEPLFDSIVPVTLAGSVAAAGESLRLRMKRKVKQSPWAWAAVRQFRKLRASRSGGAPDRTDAVES